MSLFGQVICTHSDGIGPWIDFYVEVLRDALSLEGKAGVTRSEVYVLLLSERPVCDAVRGAKVGDGGSAFCTWRGHITGLPFRPVSLALYAFISKTSSQECM